MTTRILLVEDEPDLLDLLSEALIQKGMKVTKATTGAEAIDHLRSGGEFDVMVSDIAMPGQLSGIDVAYEVQTVQPHLRIILTSGHPLSHFPPIPPYVEFLPKPYRVKQLVEVLTRHRG
jgi:DNA-binding NtrC family response regulator